ncbi:MAG: TonB-dependent receptor [Pseudomonadota bacterium]
MKTQAIPFRRSMLAVALAATLNQATAQEEALLAAVVEIVGSTPLASGMPRGDVAAARQGANAADLARSGALDVSEFLNRRMGSVHVNEMQGNPFQADVSYRGYTASPLLGTPQGLSIYLDGMRMNQPFGDVVSWDLIPRAAIASVSLMPGSNPLFGLNTLGGALSLRTKDGRSDPGTALQVGGGSSGRRSAEFEHGGANDSGLDWYVSGNRYHEDGWRDSSPSDVRQLFGKLGWRNAATRWHLSVAGASNELTGNGLQEQALLARDRRSVYTKPDQTDNHSLLLNLVGSHTLSPGVTLDGNAYWRKLRTATLNGDINEDSLDQSVYQPSAAERSVLAAAGYRGVPTAGANAANTPFPSWRCIGQALLRDEPGEKCNGLLNRGNSTQRNYGLSAQLSVKGELAGRANRLLAGAAYDASRTGFNQSSELGYLNPDRSVTGVKAFGDGVSGGDIDGEPFDTRVDLSGRSRTWSAYASDTLTLAPDWQATLAGRYNTTRIVNRDHLHDDDSSASLSGTHRFSRLNPALGLNYTPSSALNAYAGWSQGSRVPTAIELGCANPERPCKLPNAMAGDPPLRQVVTRTVEAGVRGEAGTVSWNAGVFSARNVDDILFVADNQAGYGYFKNVGQTRRQGVELGLESKHGALTWGAHATWLDATFRSAEVLNGSANSSNDTARAGSPGQDGTIAIRPGDRLPLTPRRMLKLFAEYAPVSGLTLSADVVAISRSTARGNENGQHQADDKYYLGSGYSAGYAVLNLGAQYHVTPQWQVQLQVNNATGTHYSSAAQLGPSGFDANGNFVARALGGSSAAGYPVPRSTFEAPGAPRRVSVTLRYTFG